jgi:hypothetical protein
MSSFPAPQVSFGASQGSIPVVAQSVHNSQGIFRTMQPKYKPQHHQQEEYDESVASTVYHGFGFASGTPQGDGDALNANAAAYKYYTENNMRPKDLSVSSEGDKEFTSRGFSQASDEKKRGNRGKYKCGLCGKPKVNHICDFVDPIPLRSVATQASEDWNLATGHPFETGNRILNAIFDFLCLLIPRFLLHCPETTIVVGGRSKSSPLSDMLTNHNTFCQPVSAILGRDRAISLGGSDIDRKMNDMAIKEQQR